MKVTLNTLITDGRISEAIEIVRRAPDYHESEQQVFEILAHEKSTPELVEAVLEAFMNTRTNSKPLHGYWVHSLSHFTDKLWERRLTDWIKRFNEVAFKGATEIPDDNCSDRLVYDFGSFSQWNDDPSEFGLTPENLAWMKWEYAGFAKKRIEAGTFESEVAYMLWQLEQPEKQAREDCNFRVRITDVEFFDKTADRLAELGHDIREELAAKKKALLEEQLQNLQISGANADDWRKQSVEAAIIKTRDHLAES